MALKKSSQDRISKILKALKSASKGNYSKILDFASKENELGQIALAVNHLLKKTQAKLSESRQQASDQVKDAGRYRHILDNIEESYFEVDLKGNLTFFNDTVLRDLGYSPEEIQGISFKRLADETNARKVYEAFHQVYITGEPIKGFDWEILKKNGERIFVEASVTLLKDEKGLPAGFRGIVRDVSARIKTQRDLQQSDERYQTILDIMNEGYLEEDLRGRITFANDAACRLMGYSREQLHSMTYRDYLTAATADRLQEIFQNVYRTKNPARLVDYDLTRPDGSVVTYEINVALKYDHTGTPCGFRILTKDVTSKKLAEVQRRESEEKYQNILEVMGEGYIETDIHGALTYLNDAGCTLIGYPREELLGKKFDKYSSAETARQINDTYREIYRTGKPRFMLDYCIIAKDGSPRIHQQNVALFTDETGRPKGFRILVRDVTERRKAEEALRESEAKYRDILETMEETYLETDMEGHFVFFNDSLCRILGFSREELLGASFRLISPPEKLDKIFEDFHEIYLTEKTRRFSDHQLIKKDGSVMYLDMTISLLRDKDGAPSGFGGFGKDVTERVLAARKIENSERHLRMITDNIRDIIWTMDFDLRWTYLSPSTLRITGFSPEEVMHMPLKAIVPTDIYTLAETALAEELAKEARGALPDEPRMTNFELPLLHKNGTPIWVEISADFNRDENGKPFEIVGVTRDITERKKAEEALRESEALYRKALETTSDGVSILQDGRYVYINQRFQKTMGIPEGYPINGHLMGSMLVPEDREAILQYYDKRLRGEQTPGKHEVRVIKPDHSLMYLQVTSVDIVYQGKPALLNFMQDVTEKKKAEDQLKESEKRYRTMTENVNDIVWILNLDLQITYASPSNVRLSGYHPEEVIRAPLADLMTPHSIELSARTLAEELEMEAGGKPFNPNRSRNFQIEVYSKSGENVWLEVTATFNRDPSGKPVEILVVGKNITERRNMEKALAESEKRYRMIVENMHDSISLVDLNFNYIYQSPSEIRLTGYTPEEVMSIPIREHLTPASYARAEETLARELELEFSGQPIDPSRAITLELEAYHKKGGTIWQEANATFQRDEDGKPISIILTTRDITARKKAEAALAVSERRYRLMAENVNDIIWTMNMNMEFTYVSESCFRVTGYKRDETQNTSLNRLLTPESYTRATKRLAEELALERSGRPFDPQRAITLEIEALHKDGSILLLEITGTFNRGDQGEITEILILGRDFTQRRKAEQALAESEQRYRMIIENMHEVIWTTDLNMKSTYVSPSCFPLTGYTAEEIMTMPLEQILTPETLALSIQIVSEELELEHSGAPVDPYRSRTMDQEICCRNGQTVWIEVTGTFIRDELGKATGMLLAGRDITARKKAEDAKDKLEAQLLQAQKMETVGRLAGGVAHDFNNMLSVILGYVDLAKLRLARQHPVLKDIAEIEKAALRSRDITAQLLAFSRKQIIEPRIIDLNEMIAHSQKALIRLIGEDIELKVRAGSSLWAIKFDPSQIEQILINLAVNARDAMPGGGKLTIETDNQTLDKHYCELHPGFLPGYYVRLSVSDSGIGMGKETLEHIFEPFFTTKEAGKGTGLGLATVYGIVKQNEGFINVYSEPGRGTAFSIYLPRTTEEKDLQDNIAEDLQCSAQGNILLVEDDAMVLQITRGMLETIGYTVTATASSGEAIELFQQPGASFDLVITDVIMPGMSGKDLRNRLTEIKPDVRVLFMSGYTADVIAHHGVLEEGVLFLQKPFTIQSLAQKTAYAMTGKA